jgi:hypothetical protein
MILVPYDGVRRASEIEIESIQMWIRIYDIPAAMMTDGFARALGTKIGKVIEVGGAYNDYKRVRIEFPLDKPVQRTVQQKVKGHGVMEFLVRYENIPYFCFYCGCIGHAQSECPEEGAGGGDVRYGQILRCSPQKQVVVRRPKPAVPPPAKRGLNFSGDQKRKVMGGDFSSSASPMRDSNYDWEEHNRKKDLYQENSGSFDGEIPVEVQVTLARGVASMEVDVKNTTDPDQPSQVHPGKVSGLDSYTESSEGAGSTLNGPNIEHMSMQDRLKLVKNLKTKTTTERRGAGGIAKGQQGVLHGGNQSTPVNEGVAASMGESPAKRSRLSTVQPVTLTGPREEARQAQ